MPVSRIYSLPGLVIAEDATDLFGEVVHLRWPKNPDIIAQLRPHPAGGWALSAKLCGSAAECYLTYPARAFPLVFAHLIVPIELRRSVK